MYNLVKYVYTDKSVREYMWRLNIHTANGTSSSERGFIADGGVPLKNSIVFEAGAPSSGRDVSVL